MIKAAIVEDDAASRDLLAKFLDRYQEEHNCPLEYTSYENGVKIATAYDVKYDVIFMDIDMPAMSGMEAAAYIRKADKNVAIVFVTNVAHYAIKGYEVEAMDFIVKPICYENFEFRMNRIVNRIEKSEAMVVLNSNDVIHRIKVSDILYIEVLQHTLTYYTKWSEIKVRGAIKDAEEKLNRHGFCRCDSCYLVNLRYVTKIEENDIYLGHTRLHVSRARKKTVIRALTEVMELEQ